MVRWVFFDVGNVLLDEDPLTYRNFRLHAEAIRRARPDRTFAALLAEREARAAAGSRWPLSDVVARDLDEVTAAGVWDAAAREIRAGFAALSPPVRGAATALERLEGRYRLGLIANQGAECRTYIEALGWLARFEVVAFGEECGLYKPDRRLFQSALDRAGARPGECLMVGDRLDNDVAPAAALGMATAWIRWPRRAAKGWPPPSGADADGEALAYLASLERASARAASAPGAVAPSIVIDTIDQLPDAISALSG